MAAASPPRSGTPGDWVVFGLLGLFWGTSYLFIKIAVETLPTFTLIAGRLGIGTLVLAVALLLRRVRFPREPRVYLYLAVLSIFSISFPFSLITWGERSIDSALASILNATVPLFTIVLAALVLHDEPMTVNRLVGLGVGFVGIVVLTSGSLTGATDSSILGELAMLGSSASYAVGNVFARRTLRGQDPLIPAFFQVLFAFATTLLLALVFERPADVTLVPEAAFSVVWLGIFGSGLAYLCFYHLLARWGSTRSSMVAYLLPIVGIVGGFLVLGETVDARLLAGTALVIGGIGLVNSRFGTRKLLGRGG